MAWDNIEVGLNGHKDGRVRDRWVFGIDTEVVQEIEGFLRHIAFPTHCTSKSCFIRKRR